MKVWPPAQTSGGQDQSQVTVRGWRSETAVSVSLRDTVTALRPCSNKVRVLIGLVQQSRKRMILAPIKTMVFLASPSRLGLSSAIHPLGRPPQSPEITNIRLALSSKS